VFCSGSYNGFFQCRSELASGYTYDIRFQDDGNSSKWNFVFGMYGPVIPIIEHYNSSGVDLGYNPGNQIISRGVDMVALSDQIQMHSGGYRKSFIKYSLAEAELQFIDNNITVLSVSDSDIDFRGTQAIQFRTKACTIATLPTANYAGEQVFLYDVNKPAWYTGAVWKYADGTNV